MIKPTAQIALLALCGFSSSAPAQTELLFNSIALPGHFLNTGLVQPYAKEIERITEGRVRVRIPAQSVAPPPDQVDAVQQGLADVAYIFNAFVEKRAPLMQIAQLPLLQTTAEGNAVALWRTYKRYFEPRNEFGGVVVLGAWSGPGGELYSMKDPIESVASLKKFKMWTLPGTSARALTALGVPVVPGPAVRIFEIVSKGTVDGHAGLAIGDLERYKIDQFTRSVTLVPGKLFAPTFTVFMNEKRWAALSERDRKAIEGVSGEALARLARNWDEADRAGEQRFRAGKQVVTPSSSFVADLEKAWKPLHEEWIANANKSGIDGKAAFGYFVEQSRAVSASR
ncbi:MAG: TRAP transporter substrate-binding protein DctP [Burkholderiales bacterium]